MRYRSNLRAGRTLLAGFILLICFATSAQAAGDRVLVFAAASLKNAMDDVAASYMKSHDTDVRVSYAGSSTLARQIESGAPAQVYVSANQSWMDKLEQDERIDADSRVDLLRNHLVLAAPKDSDIQLHIARGFDLAGALGKDGYLAMANTDAVPAGIYGRNALQALGDWDSLQGHIAQADDVRAALALIARGQTPLGVVYASDAVAEDDVRVVDTFPDDTHKPIVYPAALTAGSDDPAARDFLNYLASDAAKPIFKRWGFGVVGAD